MNDMSNRTIIYEDEEFDLELYQLYKDISSKHPVEIEEFRVRLHAEIDSNRNQLKDVCKMHKFIDLLMDTCIKTAQYREQPLSAAM